MAREQRVGGEGSTTRRNPLHSGAHEPCRIMCPVACLVAIPYSDNPKTVAIPDSTQLPCRLLSTKTRVAICPSIKHTPPRKQGRRAEQSHQSTIRKQPHIPPIKDSNQTLHKNRKTGHPNTKTHILNAKSHILKKSKNSA